MKRVLFITSHFCSGSSTLFEALSEHPRIEGCRTSTVYESIYDLVKLTSMNHKLKNSSAIYMDELLVNHSLACKTLYRECNYVFVIREPRGTLNEITGRLGYTFGSALSYYTMRLNRLSAIAKNAKNAVFLKEEDLEGGAGGEQIAKMLSLREPVLVKAPMRSEFDDAVPQKVLLEAEKVYKETLAVMNSRCLVTA